LCCLRYFWIFVAMARPMDPRPIHPRLSGSCVDMSSECRK
jgi:hypothetical protein